MKFFLNPILLWTLAYLQLGVPILSAQCDASFGGDFILDIAKCEEVPTDLKFKEWDLQYDWVKNLNGKLRSDFIKSYQGSVVSGSIVDKLDSKTSAMSKGKIAHKKISVFLPKSLKSCSPWLGKRVMMKISEVCCNGSGNSPCLLNLAYTAKDASVVGVPLTSTKDIIKNYVTAHPNLKPGLVAFEKKKYDEAINYLHPLSSDLIPSYLLAFAHRSNQEPKKAIPLLEKFFHAYEHDKLNGDELMVSRDALFLLARVYAMSRMPAKTISVLNLFLSKPEFFKKELQQAYNHEDFGWIKTSPEWQDFWTRQRQGQQQAL